MNHGRKFASNFLRNGLIRYALACILMVYKSRMAADIRASVRILLTTDGIQEWKSIPF